MTTTQPLRSEPGTCWECEAAPTHFVAFEDAEGGVFSGNGAGYAVPLCDEHRHTTDTVPDFEDGDAADLHVRTYALSEVDAYGKILPA